MLGLVHSLDLLVALEEAHRANWNASLGPSSARREIHRELSKLCGQACNEILDEVAVPTITRLFADFTMPDLCPDEAQRTLRWLEQRLPRSPRL